MAQKKVLCPYCNQPAEWVSNEVVYGRRYGKSHMMYLCRACDARVGCHNNTRDPLGTLANRELRKARCDAHAVLDELWKSKEMSRGDTYRWLASVFNRDVHVGSSTVEECRQIIAKVKERGESKTS